MIEHLPPQPLTSSMYTNRPLSLAQQKLCLKNRILFPFTSGDKIKSCFEEHVRVGLPTPLVLVPSGWFAQAILNSYTLQASLNRSSQFINRALLPNFIVEVYVAERINRCKESCVRSMRVRIQRIHDHMVFLRWPRGIGPATNAINLVISRVELVKHQSAISKRFTGAPRSLFIVGKLVQVKSLVDLAQRGVVVHRGLEPPVVVRG